MFDEMHTDHDSFEVNIDEIEQCIAKLKLNKTSAHDGLAAEHIVHSHPALVLHLKLLFWILIKIFCVLDSFGLGTMVLIVKDYRGDLCSVKNYRPITVSPV